MKNEITGYLTGLIDAHNRDIEFVKKFKLPSVLRQCHEDSAKELTDLLGFVEDIQEESTEDFCKELFSIVDKMQEQWDSFQVIAKDNLILRKEIAELKDSCENMCEVERNLHFKMEQLETENRNWKYINNEVNVVNKNLYKQIDILKTDFNLKQVTCNLLKRESEDSKENCKTWSKKWNHVNEINENLLGELGELKTDNAGWQIACNKLKERNEILEEKFKLHEQTLKTRKCIGRMDK